MSAGEEPYEYDRPPRVSLLCDHGGCVLRKANTKPQKVPWWLIPQVEDRAFISELSFSPSYSEATSLCFKGKGSAVALPNGDGTSLVTIVKDGQGGFKTSNMHGKNSPFWKFGVSLLDGEKISNDRKGKYDFAIDHDKIPLSLTNTGPSMGPNGVLREFPEEPRINIFQDDIASAVTMLGEFMNFRDANENLVLKKIVELMGKKLSSSNDSFDHVREIFEQCAKHEGPLCDIGIGLRSFCQTWDVERGTPNFSVPSPHFQTRVYVMDGGKLYDFLKTRVDVSWISARFLSYGAHVKKLKASFKEEGYEKKFVDLDNFAYGLQRM